MQTAIKIIIFAVLAAVAVSVPGVYKFAADLFWSPPTSFAGVSLGMSKSDVIFHKGAGTCSEKLCEIDKVKAILDAEKKVSHFLIDPEHIEADFASVEGMQAKLGEETILSVHQDLSQRRYSYAELQISFLFDTNQLASATIGPVIWGDLPPVGEYYIAGEKICPGDDCPWDPESLALKADFSEKNYSDLLPE